MNNFKITADYREKPSGIIEILEKNSVRVDVKCLDAGDYLINDQVIIERKSAEDFVQSIICSRLFDQCSGMKKKNLRNILLIEGNPYQTSHKMNKSAVKGAILSVLADWQIPIMFSKDRNDTAEILIMLCRQVNKNNSYAHLPSKYKSKKIKSQKLHFLQGLPAVGLTLASRLLEEFDSIESVINATAGELTGVKGIGKKGALKIRKFLE